MTYKQLQARLKLYREAGYTTIPLNSSYKELALEYCRVVDISVTYRYTIK